MNSILKRFVMSKIFDGKIAIITGATSGIGRAAAIDFAEKGATVILTGRREDKGKETVDLVTKSGGKGQFIKADAAKESDCKMMVETALEKYGRLDYAFNNAGIEGVIAPTIEQTDENFQTVMNINVLGVLNSMKYQIPAMLKNGGGAIVNNASVASMIGMPGMSVYCASKYAVVGLSKVAALEFSAQGVRVNVVSPAAVKTEMYDRFTGGDEAMIEQFAKMHPIGRVGESMEIGKAVTFLCSPDASFITGVNIPVDGGFTSQ